MADVFGKQSTIDPFNQKGGAGDIFSANSQSAPFGSSNKLDLENTANLQLLAEQNGFKEKKTLNAVQKVGRFLNKDIAAIAGGVRGAILPNETIREGAARGLKENIGFADVLREVVGTPSTRAGKVAIGVTGFAADILFSPVTYLTFGVGAGAKISGKVLTKTATKEALKGAKEIRTASKSMADQFIKEGVDPARAVRLAESGAKRDINELFQKIVSKEGLTKESAEKFIEKGLNTNTVENIARLGPTLLDKGGIKWFGKTLITSEKLARTPVGQAAKRISESELGKSFGGVVGALKNTLGRTFVFNFGKNPEVARILEKTSIKTRRAAVAINDAVDKIFKGTTDEQQVRLFKSAFDERLGVIEQAKRIEETHLTDFNKQFPGLNIKDKETAKKIIEGLEDTTQKSVEQIRTRIDEIVKPFFAGREAAIKTGGALGAERAGLQAGIPKRGLSRVDELNRMKDDLQKLLRDIRKSKKGEGSLALKSGKEIAVELTDESATKALNQIIKHEEERLEIEIVKLADLARKAKLKPSKIGGVKGAKLQKATELEEIILAEKQIKKLQDDLTQKSIILGKVLDAKRTAKAAIRGKRLMFEDDKQLQAISDLLFEGDNSVVAKMSKLAGISEADTYKFYLPSIFKDVTTIKAFSRGVSSPKLDFLKEFHGAEGEKQIRNAAEALKRGRVQITTARIKSDAIKNMFSRGGLGKPLSEMTEIEASKLGYKKFSRNLIDGKFEGWVPKELHDDLVKFFEPSSNPVDDLAKATGFDYATGLFKGWVTSMFPAFHFRNMTSNQFQLMMKFGVDALNPRFQKTSLEIMLTKNFDKKFLLDDGTELTYKQIIDKIRKESDFLDRGAFSDIEQMLEGVKQGASLNPLSRRFIGLEKGREWGTLIESQSKLTGVLAGLSKGQNIKDAIKGAEDALFNYRHLTEFERSIMRRMIPFYTWARKNFEFQIKTLASTPGRTAAQIKAINGIEESFGEPLSESDEKGLPSWIVDRLGIKVGNKKLGDAKFLTGLGLPIEEFLSRFSGDKGFVWNTISNIMVQMNPLVKYPIEISTGVDLFRGRPIVEISNGKDMKQIISALEGTSPTLANEFKDLIQWKEVEKGRYVNGVKIGIKTEYTANPFALHFFRNLPTARLQQTVATFKNAEELSTFENILRFTTGITATTIDEQNQQFWDDLRKKEELVTFLKRMGVIGQKDILFQKK